MERKQLNLSLHITNNFFEGRKAIAVFVYIGLVSEHAE